MPGEFEWDETLYAGSAHYYATGRVPSPAELAELRELQRRVSPGGLFSERMGEIAVDVWRPR